MGSNTAFCMQQRYNSYEEFGAHLGPTRLKKLVSEVTQAGYPVYTKNKMYLFHFIFICTIRFFFLLLLLIKFASSMKKIFFLDGHCWHCYFLTPPTPATKLSLYETQVHIHLQHIIWVLVTSYHFQYCYSSRLFLFAFIIHISYHFEFCLVWCTCYICRPLLAVLLFPFYILCISCNGLEYIRSRR